MKTKKPKFRRTDGHKYSKLGVRRKKKQIYRKAKGRDNKIRLNMKGHVRNVRIGFRSEKSKRGLYKGLKPVVVYNLDDLKKIKQGMIGIIGRIGMKKKKEIIDYAIEKKIELGNVNIDKFKRKVEERMKKSKEKEKQKIEKKKTKEKKVKEKEKQDKEDEKKQEEGKAKENGEGKAESKEGGDKKEQKLEEKFGVDIKPKQDKDEKKVKSEEAEDNINKENKREGK